MIINYIFYKNRRIYFYKINSCGTDDCFVSSLLRSDCIVWRARNVASGSNRFVLPMTGPGTDRHGRPLPDSHRKGLFGFGSEKIKDGRHPADAVRRRTIHSKKGPDEGSQGPGEVACHPPVNKKNITKSYARNIPR